METKISPAAYFIFSALISLGLLLNFFIVKSPLVAGVFGLLFLIFYSYIFGSIFFSKLGWQLIFGCLLLFCTVAIAGALAIYFFSFNDYVYLLFILGLPVALLFPYRRLQYRDWYSWRKQLKDYWHQFSERREPKINLALVGLYLILVAAAFALLIKGQTIESIQSPWQTVKPYFFPLYFLASAVLAFYLLNSCRTKLPLTLIAIHAGLSSLVAVMVYQIGYGFDPFIHQATEKIIAQTGTISPRPLYYLGQYALVIFLNRLTAIDLTLVDRILVPALFSVFLPATVFYVFRHWLSRNFALTLALAALLVPYNKFIMTAPQNLANLFFLITILLSLLYYKNHFSLFVLLLLTGATLAIHLLAGLPLLIVVFLLALYKIMYDSYRRVLTLYLLPAALFLLVLPLAFMVNGSRLILAWPDFKKTDFLWLYWVDHYDLPLNLAYLIFYNRNIIAAVVILIGLVYLGRHRLLKNNAPYFAAAAILFGDFYFCRYFLTFPALRENDRADFVGRLALLGFYILFPFFLLGVYRLIRLFWRDDFYRKLFLIFCLAGLLTVSLYFSYPKIDQYQPEKFFSLSAADVKAVNFIERSAAADHIVLANQMVSVAAISEFGFKKYYDGQFYYSMPMGERQTLYEGYLDMIYNGAKKETMAKAMAAAGVSESYFVINSYWNNFNKIVTQASKSAQAVYNIDGGKIYIFKYTK